MELPFPEKGLDVRFSPTLQPPGTTAVGQNVRLFEALTNRPRGGSRAGISRYVPEQVAGDQAVQHLNLIVTASGEALGWSFEGRDMADPNQLGVDFGPAGISNAFDGPAGGGGGGYQPSVSFQEHRYQISLAPSSSSHVFGENVDITATVTNQLGPVFLARVTFDVVVTLASSGAILTQFSQGPSFTGISGQTSITVSFGQSGQQGGEVRVNVRARVVSFLGDTLATSSQATISFQEEGGGGS